MLDGQRGGGVGLDLGVVGEECLDRDLSLCLKCRAGGWNGLGDLFACYGGLMCGIDSCSAQVHGCFLVVNVCFVLTCSMNFFLRGKALCSKRVMNEVWWLMS